MSGLRPDIAKHVLMSDPKTTNDVIESARMAELAVRTESTSEKQHLAVNMAAEINDHQMRQLCDELARLKVAVSDIQATNTVRAITRSPTIPRVRFADSREQPQSPVRSTSPRPRPTGQQQYYHQQFNNNGFDGRQRAMQREQPQGTWRQSTASFPRYRNTANNIQCRFCGIFGHKILECRKRISLQTQGARRPQQNGFRQF